MTAHYVRLLAAAQGKQGNPAEANRAWQQYRKSWKRREGQFWIAAAVQFYPFQQDAVLRHLAEGFRAAGGVERPPSPYLKLIPENRLSGAEIRALLFGREIRGEDYWLGDSWQQQRSADGEGRHIGANTFSATEDEGVESGESWVEGDRLCDRWSEADGGFTICVLIFRDPDRGANHYYMVTDTGPHPFTVIE